MKRVTQKDRILAALGCGGWVSNIILNGICFRYGARIYELRKEGYDIEKVADKNRRGVFLYKIVAQ